MFSFPTAFYFYFSSLFLPFSLQQTFFTVLIFLLPSLASVAHARGETCKVTPHRQLSDYQLEPRATKGSIFYLSCREENPEKEKPFALIFPTRENLQGFISREWCKSWRHCLPGPDSNKIKTFSLPHSFLKKALALSWLCSSTCVNIEQISEKRGKRPGGFWLAQKSFKGKILIWCRKSFRAFGELLRVWSGFKGLCNNWKWRRLFVQESTNWLDIRRLKN